MSDWENKKERLIAVRLGEKQLNVTVGDINFANLTPEGLRVEMQKAYAKYVYYGGLRANVKRALAKAQTDYEKWEAQKMYELNNIPELKKLTETAKRAHLISENEYEWEQRCLSR